ncbi:MAG TPA: hypothetical protein PKW11_16680, partial [Pseudomonadota bacterium]|nr:hypothetical protein [Pseudomonadota bacterium]
VDRKVVRRRGTCDARKRQEDRHREGESMRRNHGAHSPKDVIFAQVHRGLRIERFRGLHSKSDGAAAGGILASRAAHGVG